MRGPARKASANVHVVVPRQYAKQGSSHAMKTVRTAADLAINGAPPLFAEAVHVGRPNVGNHEHFLERARAILESRWLSNNGPVAQEFECRIADYIGVKHCVAMCNGTIALEIATRALDLRGEVIVPSYTFMATAHALHQHGGGDGAQRRADHGHRRGQRGQRLVAGERVAGEASHRRDQRHRRRRHRLRQDEEKDVPETNAQEGAG